VSRKDGLVGGPENISLRQFGVFRGFSIEGRIGGKLIWRDSERLDNECQRLFSVPQISCFCFQFHLPHTGTGRPIVKVNKAITSVKVLSDNFFCRIQYCFI